MTFHPFGDSALLINFEQKIDEVINARVIALAEAIEAAPILEATFITPAYCSLAVGYDPLKIGFEDFSKKIKSLTPTDPSHFATKKDRVLEIPVYYSEPHCLDMSEVMQQTGLLAPEIIEWHTSVEYRVYMMGFLPGFVYLGSLPKQIYCSRKTTPRLKVPAQSVGLAGQQTGIYPSEAPGGWQIIGRTPQKIFDSGKQNPFYFMTGDIVKFYAV